MYHGIINVYKEKGFTSHDVVAKLRGICKQKKIGHTGTLDPDAVGVLPVCLGNATRICDLLTDQDKEYVARLRLGVVTDTQDSSGRILNEREVTVSEDEAVKAILSFQGDILQVPPMYSALKVGGKKLYELARQGQVVERKPRPVTIYEIEILEESMPEFTVRVVCSKGTYIRTLCHDIGEKLGCGGIMASLTRTRVGSFGTEQALRLSELETLSREGKLTEYLIPVDRMFENLPAVIAKQESRKALQNGNQLKRAECNWQMAGEPEGQYRVYSHEGRFFGIYNYDRRRGLLCPVKMFLEE